MVLQATGVLLYKMVAVSQLHHLAKGPCPLDTQGSAFGASLLTAPTAKAGKA